MFPVGSTCVLNSNSVLISLGAIERSRSRSRSCSVDRDSISSASSLPKVPKVHARKSIKYRKQNGKWVPCQKIPRANLAPLTKDDKTQCDRLWLENEHSNSVNLVLKKRNGQWYCGQKQFQQKCRKGSQYLDENVEMSDDSTLENFMLSSVNDGSSNKVESEKSNR